MTENIARIVNARLDQMSFSLTLPCSDVTRLLLATCSDLDGARFDDVYPHVMAWLLARDRRSGT